MHSKNTYVYIFSLLYFRIKKRHKIVTLLKTTIGLILLALAVGRVDVTDVGLFDQALVLRPFDDVFVSGDEVQQRLFVLVTVFCVCHQFLQFFDASVQRRHL